MNAVKKKERRYFNEKLFHAVDLIRGIFFLNFFVRHSGTATVNVQHDVSTDFFAYVSRLTKMIAVSFQSQINLLQRTAREIETERLREKKSENIFRTKSVTRTVKRKLIFGTVELGSARILNNYFISATTIGTA